MKRHCECVIDMILGHLPSMKRALTRRALSITEVAAQFCPGIGIGVKKN